MKTLSQNIGDIVASGRHVATCLKTFPTKVRKIFTDMHQHQIKRNTALNSSTTTPIRTIHAYNTYTRYVTPLTFIILVVICHTLQLMYDTAKMYDICVHTKNT